MAVRIPWNQSEAILLVDAYFMIENGTISRKLAVQLISEELRKKHYCRRSRLMTFLGIQTESICGFMKFNILFLTVKLG